MLARDDILAIYAAGPEAVVALLESLQTTQAQQLQSLTARVAELEARLAKHSHNSGKPPSSDGLTKRTQSLRQPSGQKPGGQPGHRGTTLALTTQPDVVVTHTPRACHQCGTTLVDVTVCAAGPAPRRQVYEVPPLRLQVTEHVTQTKCCPQCHTLNQGPFPSGVTQAAQYGPHFQALAVYLGQYQLLPFARTRQLLHDLFGHAPSTGTLATWVATCARHLEPVAAAMQASLTRAPVVNFDETGLRIAGSTHWLHSASTPQLTCYAPHRQRGHGATDAIGLLPHFRGRAVHDAWASYYHYACQHALCNAHLLRELRFIHEHLQQPWAKALSRHLCRIKSAVASAQEQGLTHLEARHWRRLEQRYQELLERGWQANPAPPRRGQRGRPKQGPARNLLARLTQRQSEILAFATDFNVPFDNNLAERDLRMTKVQQKISGGFRSMAGAKHFCRIRGYLSTLRKQRQDVLLALRSTFIGQPLYPAFST